MRELLQAKKNGPPNSVTFFDGLCLVASLAEEVYSGKYKFHICHP